MGKLVLWSISKGKGEHLRVDHHWGPDSFDGRGGLTGCDAGNGRGTPQSFFMGSLDLCWSSEDEWLQIGTSRHKSPRVHIQ